MYDTPRGDLKAITTRSGISYDGPPIPPPFSPLSKVVEREPETNVSSPSGIAEDVFVNVGKFHFPVDFVLVDYVVDLRVPLISGPSEMEMKSSSEERKPDGSD
ncbi:hypothetical protein Tco_1457789 [Tanacetum coccineum]